MSEIRERIVQAGELAIQQLRDEGKPYEHDEDLIAAACEALRLAKERMQLGLGHYAEFDKDDVCSILDSLLTEIETGSREETENLGADERPRRAQESAPVAGSELPHDGSGE